MATSDAVYSEEKGREGFNAVVYNPQDFTDTWFPAWQSCAQRAGASGVMCSYNAVNGVGLCGNEWLLTEKLRGDFEFDGYVTSDCGAVGDKSYRNISHSHEQTLGVTWGAGTDVNCGSVMTSELVLAALANSTYVTEAMMDTALTRLITIQIRLGFYNSVASLPGWAKFNTSVVATPGHTQLAKDAADQALVLLKNDDAALPLSRAAVTRLAVVGPSANATELLQGNYHGGSGITIIPPYQALQAYAAVDYVPGCGYANNNMAGIAAAVAVASASDATIIVAGDDQHTGGSEGHDPATRSRCRPRRASSSRR